MQAFTITAIKRLIICTLIFLVSCNSASTPDVNVQTGIKGAIPPVEISIMVNQRGEVTVSGSVSIPLKGVEELGISWVASVDVTFNKAREKSYQLLVLGEGRTGNARLYQYDVAKPFKIRFSSDEWVSSISSLDNGSIVVKVQRNPLLNTPTPSPLPLVSSGDDCHKSKPSRLRVGIIAYVSSSPSDPNRVRDVPTLRGKYLGQMYPNEEFRILDGSVCADGYRWWKVSSLAQSLIGWSVEGDSSSYWLIPK